MSPKNGMKSELQVRAEKAAEKFENARKPVVFEFAWACAKKRTQVKRDMER
jgi:hypothetical protein